MALVVTVVAEGDALPPTGAPIRVEVRDVSLVDAPATVVGTAVAEVGAIPGVPGGLAQVTVDVERVPEMSTVFVHVDVDGDGRVTVGDYITMQSYPIPAGGAGGVIVSVRRV